MSRAAILAALESGPKSTATLRAIVGTRGGSIARDCNTLIRSGQVVRIDGGSGAGKRAVYALAGSDTPPQDRPTGAQLVEAVRQRARELNLPVAAFAASLNANPDAWLRNIALAEQPRDSTIAKIEALLQGNPQPSSPRIAGELSGADLHARIITRAAELGLDPNDFIRPLSGGKHCATWLKELHRAGRPRPSTLARVDALLAGRPIPDSPEIIKRRATISARSVDQSYLHVAGRKERIDNPPTPVDRDPCFRCGVRADIGCRHRQAAWG